MGFGRFLWSVAHPSVERLLDWSLFVALRLLPSAWFGSPPVCSQARQRVLPRLVGRVRAESSDPGSQPTEVAPGFPPPEVSFGLHPFLSWSFPGRCFCLAGKIINAELCSPPETSSGLWGYGVMELWGLMGLWGYGVLGLWGLSVLDNHGGVIGLSGCGGSFSCSD